MASSDISLEPLLNLIATVNGLYYDIRTKDVGYGSMVSGRKVVTTAGAAEALTATSTPCSKVILSADLGNTNPVVIGDSSVVAASGSQQGIVLVPGNDPVTIYVNDLSEVYVDSQTDGDAVCYVYFV